VGAISTSLNRKNNTIPSSLLVPDVIAYPNGFVVCSRDSSGELALSFVDASTLSPVALPVRVKRLSKAEIQTCRLAFSAQAAAIAVAWQERIPPASANAYLSVVPLSQ
jgi:hypothetical protein